MLANTTSDGIAPMLAVPGTLKDLPPSRFGYEFKWDGMRALVSWDGRRLAITSRNGRDLTPAFPELAPLAKALAAVHCVLDGEIVALNDKGRPDFELLQQRMGLVNVMSIRSQAAQTPAKLLLFDLLTQDNQDLTGLPYRERRKRLAALHLEGPAWATPKHHRDGQAVIEVSRRMGLEGIMAKRLDSPYLEGVRSEAWVKIRNRMRQEFVIGGWTEGREGRAGHPGSLVVGHYGSARDPALMVCVGKVGSGLSGRVLERLELALRALATTKNPFDASGNAFVPDVHFIKPKLVCEVEFAHLTRQGVMRQPAFKGLRFDKDPREVVWEQVEPEPIVTAPRLNARARPGGAGKEPRPGAQKTVRK